MSDSTGRSIAQQVGRVAGAVLLLLVGIAAVLVVLNGRGADEPLDRPSADTSTEPTEEPTGVPTAGGSTTGAQPAGQRKVLLRITPQPDGLLRAVERVQSVEPINTLVLQVPPARDSLSPFVSGLTLDVDGQRLQLPEPGYPVGQWEVLMPEGATEVVMRYVLDGATDRSRPELDTRALLVVRPLSAELAEGAAAEGESTAVVEILDVVVHNLVCPDRPTGKQLCGRQQGGRLWRTASVPSADSTVVAQVDLPRQ